MVSHFDGTLVITRSRDDFDYTATITSAMPATQAQLPFRRVEDVITVLEQFASAPDFKTGSDSIGGKDWAITSKPSQPHPALIETGAWTAEWPLAKTQKVSRPMSGRAIFTMVCLVFIAICFAVGKFWDHEMEVMRQRELAEKPQAAEQLAAERRVAEQAEEERRKARKSEEDTPLAKEQAAQRDEQMRKSPEYRQAQEREIERLKLIYLEFQRLEQEKRDRAAQRQFDSDQRNARR